MTNGTGGRDHRKGSDKRKNQRQHQPGRRRTRITLELTKFVKFSKVREERFDGLEILRIEDEQHPKLSRWVGRIPWLASMSYWAYYGFKSWTH